MHVHVYPHTKELERKLRTAQRAMEGKIIGVTLKHRKTAEWDREQTGIADIIVEVKKKRTWAGHAMRTG